MATKAQLEAELAALRAKLAESQAAKATASQDAARKAADKQGSAPADADTVTSILEDHDIRPEELEDVWHQFVAELEEFPQRKPLLTAAAAFALGFILGRATR
jgi:ElaB/YqjD/DUF883 family membrane-anchored ribosome-binding protein